MSDLFIPLPSKTATFAMLLEMAELAPLLSRRGPFTVFAPSNAAFDKLLPGVLAALQEPASQERLARLLLHHVAPVALPAADLVNGAEVTTLAPDPLPVQRASTLVVVGGALLLSVDAAADNGFVHAVDTVLVPSESTTSPVSTVAPQTTPLPGGSTTQPTSSRPLNLLAPRNTDGSLLPDADGSIAFDGVRGLRVTAVAAVSGQQGFSLTLTVAQSPGTSGYFFAKTDATGSRFYSLYASQVSQSLAFYYRTLGSATQRVARFLHVLNDGEPHRVLLTVNGTRVRLSVDDGASFLGTETLEGPVNDCGDASPSCVFSLGQRLTTSGTSLALSGRIFYGRLYYEPLAENPAPALPTAPPATASPMTTTTSTSSPTTAVTSATSTAAPSTATTLQGKSQWSSR